MYGPTWIFWANLTPFTLEVIAVLQAVREEGWVEEAKVRIGC
jgi:hypothetical protein